IRIALFGNAGELGRRRFFGFLEFESARLLPEAHRVVDKVHAGRMVLFHKRQQRGAVAAVERREPAGKLPPRRRLRKLCLSSQTTGGEAKSQEEGFGFHVSVDASVRQKSQIGSALTRLIRRGAASQICNSCRIPARFSKAKTLSGLAIWLQIHKIRYGKA